MGKRNIWLRRIVQTIFLGLWALLFWQTAHSRATPIPPDLFLVTDPLVSILAMAAARVWIPAFLWSLILVVLTLVFGRFFCGWLCPLGTIFDVIGRLWKGRETVTLGNDREWRRVKYYVLAALGIGALFGGQLVYWGDPLVFTFRALAMGIFSAPFGATAFLTFAIFLVILGLCGVTHRFWCRYLCPLGAFYGALARYSIFRRRLDGCDACKSLENRQCHVHCGMAAAAAKQGSPDECTRCMLCQDTCPKAAPKFVPSWPFPATKEHLISLDRRTFVVGLGVGTLAGISSSRALVGSQEKWRLVRPPMVTRNEVFEALCVRCGQCIRSCPTGTLQPLFLEGGFAGLWTPAITPRIGGCVENCNACSIACPTQAIPPFGPSRPEKWPIKMGQAIFATTQCISYAPDAVKPCLKCVEACPNKAIIVDHEAKPDRPKVVNYDRCVGCGKCETACAKMTIGPPALTLTNNGVGNPTSLVVDPTPDLPVHADAEH